MNRFGFFGQLIDNKGVDIVLDALILLVKQKRVPPQGIVLEINGANAHYATSAYLDRIKGQVAELGRLGGGPIEIRDRGPYTRDQLADRMRAVDWVLVPSTWWEVYGLVLSEAWMFGRPVLVSDIGGLGERVTQGVDGFRVPARDVPALAVQLAAMVGDEALWRRLNAGIRPGWSATDMLAAHERLWAEAASTDLSAPRDVVARPGA